MCEEVKVSVGALQVSADEGAALAGRTRLNGGEEPATVQAGAAGV